MHPELCVLVAAKLELRWSPQQISGWLSESYPDRPEMRVSHETIYLSLFVQSRGAPAQGADPLPAQRPGDPTTRPAGLQRTAKASSQKMVNISERPAEVEDRAVPGHWEGDLVFGTANSAMATLVERHSRFVMLVGLPDGHTADVVADALAAKIAELPERLRRSFTWDQGKEMARPRPLHRRHRRARLLLRSPQPLATRHQREHQRSAPPVLPETQAASRSTRPTSTPSPTSSTDALDKPSAGSHHQSHSTWRCDDRLRPRAFWGI